MQVVSYFAHAGHEHLDATASDKGSDALIIAGIVAIIVGVMVVALLAWDAKGRNREK